MGATSPKAAAARPAARSAAGFHTKPPQSNSRPPRGVPPFGKVISPFLLLPRTSRPAVRLPFGRPLPAILGLALAAAFLLSLFAAAPSSPKAQAATGGEGVFQTTRDYVTRFYPRWFTYYQQLILPANKLTMPRRITSLYKTVVAINDDTYYASAATDLSKEPAILTIPSSRSTYSILALTNFGEVIETSIEKETPGTYALVGPGWTGTLPAGVTRVDVPYDHSLWIIRADKHSSNGAGVLSAQRFVRALRLAPLSEYEANSSTGATDVVSELFYAIPFKQLADEQARYAPVFFLKELQKAVNSADTEPLSESEQQLIARFNAFFGENGSNAAAAKRKFKSATRFAHASILGNYHRKTIARNWINFENIAVWLDPEFVELSKTPYLDRAAITEYILYGNNFEAAAYYHTFKDRNGDRLNGKNGRVYVLKFSKKQLPEAERFWSLTAYEPGSIELVKNSEKKYVVASYTSGLETNKNGSVTIYISEEKPAGVPKANWLPVPAGRFNVMLRAYGPEGKVASGEYVPPGVKLRK